MIRKFVYSKFFSMINKFLLSIFYNRKYLKGKFFDEQRYGYVWAWKGIFRRLFNLRKKIDWPVGKNVRIPRGENIFFPASSVNIFQSYGCYFQNQLGKIYIGENVYIAPNVGIITANHDPENLDQHLDSEDVYIGDNCWIGMNAVILPGVKLGDNTIVGAGSVVTHSYLDGNCVIAGNPARKIK